MVINLPGKDFVVKSKGNSDSYSPLLRAANKVPAVENLVLLVLSNTRSYSESPMSGDAGYGYVEGNKAAAC